MEGLHSEEGDYLQNASCTRSLWRVSVPVCAGNRRRRSSRLNQQIRASASTPHHQGRLTCAESLILGLEAVPYETVVPRALQVLVIGDVSEADREQAGGDDRHRHQRQHRRAGQEDEARLRCHRHR